MEREDIADRFLAFLNEFYRDEIVKAIAEGKKSIEVDFSFLDKFDVELADYLLENPEEAIAIAEDALKQIDTGLLETKLRIRFFNLPESREIRIRNVRAEHIGKIIVVDGIVKRASEIRPEVSETVFQCPECGNNISIIQTERIIRAPIECDSCKNRKGFRLINQKLYDARWIVVEEPFEIVTGERPSELGIYLKEDLTSPRMQNKTDPGNRIKVVGILKELPKRLKGTRSRQMDIYLDAVHVESVEAVWEELEITEEDEKKIIELSKDPLIFQKLIGSLAPTMYEMDEVKEAIILQLFGGEPKLLKDGTKIRGNIHLLLIGDPASGKSQIMQLTSKLMPRGRYVSGSGITAAGVTATVVRDEEFLGGWVLEAGALVMANRSICCLHPSSKVILDNKIMEISNAFDEKKIENALCDGELIDICELKTSVPSFNLNSLKLFKQDTTLVRRKKYTGKILSIKLESGQEVKLTPDHLLIDGDTFSWKKAEDFKEGEFILAPLKLPSRNEKIFIFDLIPDNWKLCLSRKEKGEIKNRVLERYRSIAEFNRKIFLPKEILCGGRQVTLKQFKDIIRDLDIVEEWKRRPLKFGRKSGSIKLRISEVTPELGYILGFALGDGHLERNEHCGIRITQSVKHEKYIKNFVNNWNEVFQEELHEYEDRRESKIEGRKISSKSKVLYHGSNILVLLHNKLIGKHLENVLSLPDDVLKSFIAGVFDSNGCVCIKRCKKRGKGYKVAHVEFLLSKNPEINLNFMLALRRLDVYSKLVRTDKNIDILRITGREDVLSLKNAISDYSVKMNVEIPQRIHKVSSFSNKLPKFLTAEICKKIVNEINTSLLNRTNLKMMYPYINFEYQPSRDGLEKILKKIGNNLSSEIKGKIEGLLQRDFFLDRIVKIGSENYSGFVYDLHVPKTNNFVADGTFVHNCIDEFSKVAPQDRVALQEAMSLESYHPNTQITLSDGTCKEIKELVEDILEKHRDKIKIGDGCMWVELNNGPKILTTDFFDIYPTGIIRVSKHLAPEYFYLVKISTGKELIVTPRHPFFILKEGNVTQIDVEDLKKGDFVPIPSIVPLDGKPQKIEVEESKIRNYHPHTKHISIPTHNSPALCRFLGYIASEGCVYENSNKQCGVCFTNSNEKILDDFKNITRSIFSLEPKIDKREGRTMLFYNSVELKNFIKQVASKLVNKSWEKELPSWVMKLPKYEIRHLLRSLFDGDGSVSRYRVNYTTTSKSLALQVQDLLHIFGIISYLKKRTTKKGKSCWDVTVSGAENLEKFIKKIGFSDEDKNRHLNFYLKKLKYRASLSNTIPNIQSKIETIMKRLKAYQKEVCGYMLTDYFDKKYNFTRKVVKRIIKNFEKRVGLLKSIKQKIAITNSRKDLRSLRKHARISTFIMAKKLGVSYQMVSYLELKAKRFPCELYKKALTEVINEMLEAEKEVESLKKLAFGEIRWVKVISVEKVKNEGEEWVYDITTENEKFVSNGMVLHNTISIAKASIVATLPAQTAILAGGNPKLGRFDPYIPIREQVDIDDVLLSLDYNEPILIKENNAIKMEKIGSFVDRYCNGSNIAYLDGSLEVPALNLQTLRVEFWPVKYIFRHKINEPLLKLVLETGREIKVTKGHSVYVFEDCEIKPKKTSEIKIGDFIVIPNKLPKSLQHAKEINLVRELLKLPEDVINTIYLHNVPKEVFSRLGIKNKSWMNNRRIPLRVASKLTEVEIKNCYLKYKGAPSKVPVTILIKKELMRLLGYYVAEGSMFVTSSKEHLISFSLNKGEENIIEDLRKISKKLFDHEVTYIKDGRGIKVNIANKIVYLLFKQILKVKGGAENKEVPNLVFNVSPELQKEFLRAYYLGDYGVTVSKKLASDLLYLFLQNNIVASISYNKPREALFPDRHTSRGKTSYVIADAIKRFRKFESTKWHSWVPLEAIKDFLKPLFQSKYKGYGEKKKYRFLTENWWKKVFLRKKGVKLLERLSLLQNCYTVDKFTRKFYPKSKLRDFRTKREWIREYLNRLMKKGFAERQKVKGIYKYSLSEKGKEILEKIKTVQRIFSSDLGFARVKEIREEYPTSEYVYDISTPGHENFVGGFGGIVCHNSRFDLRFALRDIPNPEIDTKMAEHVLRMRHFEEETKPLLPPEFLRKYIAYARSRVHPTLTVEAGERIKEFYLEMRAKAGEEAPVSITLRQYEALIRLAEASAKIRLSDAVEMEDAERAIRLMKVSLRQFGFEPETGRIDIDRAEGLRLTAAQRSRVRIMLDVIDELTNIHGKDVPMDEIISRAKTEGIDNPDEILRKMQSEGMLYSSRPGMISKV